MASLSRSGDADDEVIRAWFRDEPGVRDMCIFEAPEEEGIYLAEIDMDMVRKYRENEVMGDRFRHPDKYGILCGKGDNNE